MHHTRVIIPGVWLCSTCLALSVDGEMLASRYREEQGEEADANDMAHAVAWVLADMYGCPVTRVDHFTAAQVLQMHGHPCPHNAEAAGIPEGKAEVVWAGGEN